MVRTAPTAPPPRRLPWRLGLSLTAAHLALGLWALAAWVGGPFQGEGILDGSDVLRLAVEGTARAIDTKSPLYPWLLGRLIELTGEVPWTVGLLGLGVSTATLWGVGLLCVQVGSPRAAPWAMGAWVLSGSVYAFAVQPLPVGLATALLVGGALALHRAGDSRAPVARASAAGLLLAASVFCRAPLLIPAVLLLSWEAIAGRARSALLAAAGAALFAVLCLSAFGPRAWPEGSALNLRQGNGAERTGISDLRPGPAYDRVRYEAAFAPAEEVGGELDLAGRQLALLRRELAADPAGAAVTLLRKAFLFWHRTEHHTAADFRHGLSGFAPLALLLASFGLIAPLALAGLRRGPPPLLWLPAAGVFLVNLAYLTSSRYRFPALPFLCAAAGLALASRMRRGRWIAAVALVLALNANLSGIELVFRGDGCAQQGHMLLGRGGAPEAAREALELAVAAGEDPRASYDLGLFWERLGWELGTSEHLGKAQRQYQRALELDPLYPQAAENLMRVLRARGRLEDLVSFGLATIRRNPYAGKVHLMLAETAERHPELAPEADPRALRARGHGILALRSLAQNALEEARRCAGKARDSGLEDPRLEALLPAGSPR